MDFVFDRGDSQRPKGHALLYFHNSSAPDEVWVTYLVILPVSIDVSKYMPPFLMNQVGELGPNDLSAFAFPPAPERLGDHVTLEALADIRDDDVLSGGAVNPDDMASAMMTVGEVVQRYAEMYAQIVAEANPAGNEAEEASPELAVNDVLYGLMSDGVHAARQSTYNSNAVGTQGFTELFRHTPSVRRGVPCADNGHGPLIFGLAFTGHI